MKRKTFFVCTLLFCFVLAEICFSESVNKPSEALTALDSAINALGVGSYSSANLFAEKAAFFNPLLGDSWYVQALTASFNNEIPNKIIPLLEKALSCEQWIFYNKDAAIALYTRYLCIVKRYDDVVAITQNIGDIAQKIGDITVSTSDNLPSDFFYSRAWAFYGKNDFESARYVLEKATKRFPFEKKFQMLFFQREAMKVPLSPVQEKMALSFLSTLDNSDLESVELINASIPFVASLPERRRLLSSCYAQGVSSPELIANLLEYGLIQESEAFAEVKKFSDSGITFSILLKIGGLFSDSEIVKSFSNYLSTFNGVIVDDENNDNLNELKIFYENGRPVKIIYDENQDGLFDWEISADQGTPNLVTFPKTNSKLYYAKYPTVLKVERNADVFLLNPGKFKWTPIKFSLKSFPTDSSFKFYLPEVKKKSLALTESLLVKNSAVLKRTLDNRPNFIEQVELVDGIPVSSVLAENNRPYAYSVYEKGRLSSRKVDMDKDGSFEAFESYTWNPADKKSKLSRFWIDSNRNGNFEYIENYDVDGGKFTQYQWDYDDDGVIDAEYRLFKDGREQTIFRHPQTGLTCEILSQHGVPLSLSYKGQSKPLIQSKTGNLYWIGKNNLSDSEEEDFSKKLQELYNLSGSSFVTKIINLDSKKVLLIKSGNLYYAEIQGVSEN